ncbi:MAG: heavy metal-binding domain-containing protein [Vicinamibacterales bacterium]
MRTKLAGLMVTLLATLASAQQPARAPQPPARTTGQTPPRTGAGALPPLVYICPMPEDSEVIEDKPGKCPKCRMALVAVRLDSKFWCPIHQTVVVRDQAGKCPRDGRDLVPVTLSESWSCADKPDTKLLEPGRCADGKARTIKYELAAHGDHNPKHGGQFFMAADRWHHLEGTYPTLGLVRLHLYDNFTRPMSPKGVTGTLLLLDQMNKEVAAYPLVAARDNRTMTAKIPAARAALPLNAAVKIKFKPTEPENFFNFPFSKFSIEPPAAPAAKAPKPAAGSTPGMPGTPAASAPAAPPAAAAQEPVMLDRPLQVPPGLAEATDETRLPKNVAGLVAELNTRATDVGKLVAAGELAQVWLPAIGTKTVALVLDAHTPSLPERQRASASAAVKQIVMASWDIDNYGDLGNGTKVTAAYQRLTAAVQSLNALYAP